MKEKYRFDDDYGKIFKYDTSAHAYMYHGSYYAYGITANMADEDKAQSVLEQDCLE